MWPLLLDMTKDESLQSLRCLELEAYACLVSALRAQGSLTQDKLKLLRETGIALNISQDRQKAEIRRAVNDERLNTIAYHASGQKITSEEWAMEGRRVIPLMQRVVPQTAYSAIADDVADISSKNNRQLPNPSSTERKRPAPVSNATGVTDVNRNMTFRSAESAKVEDSKKRKMPISVDNVNLSSHHHNLMGPPKMSRIQQIYRQKTKARQKELLPMKTKSEPDVLQTVQTSKVLYQQIPQHTPQKILQKVPTIAQSTPSNVNVLQNMSTTLDTTEMDGKIETGNALSTPADIENSPSQAEAPSEKNTPSTSCTKVTPQINSKNCATLALKKTISTKSISGQKLIVVSNPQSIATTSILQRTLTIPFVKNISVKNFDKFKIVTTNSSSGVQFTTLSSIAQNTAAKHKVVTVRTNPTVKKVIPLSQLQILNAKGGIKVLPIGGKIITTRTNSGSTPVYIVNSSNMQCLTKCTSSTPVIMTCKPQGSPENKSLLVLKNSQVQSNATDGDNVDGSMTETVQRDGPDNVKVGKREVLHDDCKNSVKSEHCHGLGDSGLVQEDGKVGERHQEDGGNSEINENPPTKEGCNRPDIIYSNGLVPTVISSNVI